MKKNKVGKYIVKEHTNGDKFWYINGKYHREDGPAIELASGTKFWYFNNKYHREDGPAIEYSSGDRLWFLNGKKLTEFEFDAIEIFKNLKPRKIINAINELEI